MTQNALATIQPFAKQSALAPSVNAGAVSIEQERAVAEAKGQMQLAKMFPRDLNACYAELMDACKLKALAEVAFYSVPQGGSKVSGPSIRLAEEVARIYGNFEFGHRELGRTEPTPTSPGRSEVEVYAWDKEKNNRSIRQITVLHVLDTKDGPRRLRDQKDVDNKIANVASKQVRGRILALMPKWMVEAAIQECRKTIAGDNTEPLDVRVRKMTQAFASFGVKVSHLEKYLGKSLDAVLADELADLLGVFNSLKEGVPASELFSFDDDAGSSSDTAKKVEEAAKAGAAARAAQNAAAPAAQPAATPAPRRRPQAEAPAATPAPAAEPEKQEGNAVQEQGNPVEAQSQQPQQDAAQPQDDSAAAAPRDVF